MSEKLGALSAEHEAERQQLHTQLQQLNNEVGQWCAAAAA